LIRPEGSFPRVPRNGGSIIAACPVIILYSRGERSRAPGTNYE